MMIFELESEVRDIRLSGLTINVVLKQALIPRWRGKKGVEIGKAKSETFAYRVFAKWWYCTIANRLC